MVIRRVINFYKKKFDWLKAQVQMTLEEEKELKELFTSRNYIPRAEKETFKSFNTIFKDRLFSMPSFCKAFHIFYSNIY